MPFLELTEEQRLLQDACRSFIAASRPLSAVREAIDAGADPVGDVDGAAAELGWFATLVPESFGGGAVSERPLADLVVIAEERGRSLQPGPFVGTNVAAFAIARGGTARQQADVLPAVAAGEHHVAWVRGDALAAVEAPAGVAVDGVARAYDVERASSLLVTVAVDGTARQFLVPASLVPATPLTTLDLTAQVGELRFDGVVLPAEAELRGGDLVDAQLALAALLLAVDSVGAMDRLLELTIDYAKRRHAFGRPIGSFQAVKHHVADASMLVLACKAAVGAATEALADEHPDALEVASIAKAFVSDHGFTVAQTCLQVHGGIGYAWEHDLHLYLRRLATDSVAYGDAAFHRARIAARHGL